MNSLVSLKGPMMGSCEYGNKLLVPKISGICLICWASSKVLLVIFVQGLEIDQ
jgi:hypothetical protein